MSRAYPSMYPTSASSASGVLFACSEAAALGKSVTRIRLLEVMVRRELGIGALQVRRHAECEASRYFRKGVPSFQ